MWRAPHAYSCMTCYKGPRCRVPPTLHFADCFVLRRRTGARHASYPNQPLRLQAACKMCRHLAQVEILAEGDHVNELMVVVSGLVEVQKPSEWMGQSGEEESIRLDANSKSIHGGRPGIELGTR